VSGPKKDETIAVESVVARRSGAAATPFSGGAAQGNVRPDLVGQAACARLDGAGAAPATLGSVLCVHDGKVRLVIIVKAAFSMDSTPMTPAAAPRIHVRDLHHRARAAAHVVAPSDIVPGRSRVDVVLVGTACAPGGQPVRKMAARLAVFQQGRAFLDRTLEVVGDDDGAGAKPFVEMPLMYERAVGGLGAAGNPVGLGEDDDERPNIYDPRDRSQPAGFGPIAANWPIRQKFLQENEAPKLRAPTITLRGDFDWRYFQSAPPEQQIEHLAPDATVLIEGFDANRPRISAKLPDVQAVGVLFGAQPGAPKALVFRADTLHVDAVSRVCTITWRHVVEIESEAVVPSLCIAAGVQTSGGKLELPEVRPANVQLPTLPSPISEQALADKGATMAVESHRLSEATLPFDKGPAVPPPPAAPESPPSARGATAPMPPRPADLDVEAPAAAEPGSPIAVAAPAPVEPIAAAAPAPVVTAQRVDPPKPKPARVKPQPKPKRKVAAGADLNALLYKK